MAITIPDPKEVTFDHEYLEKPAVLRVALDAPGAVMLSTTGGVHFSGQAYVEPALNVDAAAGERIFGYVPIFPGNPGDGVACLRGTIITGFAGVVPGDPVYVGATGALTHTIPYAGARRIGVGYTPTQISLD
jgi:hypothetical protein